MENEPDQPHGPREIPPVPDGAKPKNPNSPVWALVLAFLPSVMLLSMLPFLRVNPPAWLLFLCGAVSVVCCFAASFLLFRRGTVPAIVGGIIFLLLNGFVSLLFGCGALLTQANVH